MVSLLVFLRCRCRSFCGVAVGPPVVLLLVRQIPGGEIADVQVGACNASPVVQRSIVNAVYKAAPLPEPADPSLFERNLRFVFQPED